MNLINKKYSMGGKENEQSKGIGNANLRLEY